MFVLFPIIIPQLNALGTTFFKFLWCFFFFGGGIGGIYFFIDIFKVLDFISWFNLVSLFNGKSNFVGYLML